MEIKKIQITENNPKTINKYQINNRTFDTLKEAQYYFRNILYQQRFNKIPHIKSTLDIFEDITQDWFYCKDINDLYAVISSYNGYNIDNNINEISFPQWMYVEISYEGEDGNYVYVTEYNKFKENILEALNFINSIEEFHQEGEC
jgi:hypothetical protein